MISSSIVELGSYDPRRNLPSVLSRKRGESNFVARFGRCYAAEHDGSGVGARGFPMAGYGIADFVWLSLIGTQGRGVLPTSEPLLIAFEMKLANWRRALSQAYRYGYFADQAVVVMPPKAVEAATGYIDLFWTLGVGLWSFEPECGRLSHAHTPEPARPRNPAAKARAVSLFQRSRKLRKLLEDPEPLAQSVEMLIPRLAV